MDRDYLTSQLPLFKIYTFEEIESTNSFAKTLEYDYALIVADSQSKGRGRLGREFVSPKGAGLYMSVVLKIQDMYRHIPFITTAASCAVCKTIEEMLHIPVGIKWVNDIYKDGKKVSGILCESIDGERAVVGIGVNLFPSPLPDIASSLFDKEIPLSKEDIVISITQNLFDIVKNFPDTSFLEYYKSRSIVLEKDILCIQGDTSFPAKAVDIDNRGGLVVKTEDDIKTLSTGEISIRFT